MPMDDGVRKGFAVGISTTKPKQGTLRLVLDDLQYRGGHDWTARSFFTFFDIDERKAAEFALGDQQYARIGEAIVARLLALAPDSEQVEDDAR